MKPFTVRFSSSQHGNLITSTSSEQLLSPFSESLFTGLMQFEQQLLQEAALHLLDQQLTEKQRLESRIKVSITIDQSKKANPIFKS